MIVAVVVPIAVAVRAEMTVGGVYVVTVAFCEVPCTPSELIEIAWKLYRVAGVRFASVTECEVTRVLLTVVSPP